MAIDLPMRGGCACGAIRYECNATPLFMFFCRCKACRHATGNAYAMNAWFPTEAVQFTRGSPKEYATTADSGRASRHGFCADCGSPIGMRADAFPEIRGVLAGSFDDPSALRPTANVWLSSKLPWDKPDGRLPSYAGNIDPADIEKLIAS
jgi:hypothetical protein